MRWRREREGGRAGTALEGGNRSFRGLGCGGCGWVWPNVGVGGGCGDGQKKVFPEVGICQSKLKVMF